MQAHSSFRRGRRAGLSALFVALAAGAAGAQNGFVNWESPQVSPLALTPSGATLLAVNTADNRLEVFSVAADTPVWTGAIPVGLDPVSVRARTETEAWVVNHISDSVSVVDLPTGRVVRTLATADGPADIIFAGTPQRVFVSCAKANQILVFDPANLGVPPVVVPIAADEPRMLATDPGGTTVYAAVFFSGNGSTVIPPPVVSNPAGPYAGANPPPNLGNTFEPPIAPGLPTPPPVALILKRDPASGLWLDDNIGNWSAFVPWTLADRDVAMINANNPSAGATYANGLMNINMAIAVRADGRITTVGTDAINEVRFEENLNGIFLRVNMGAFEPSNPGGTRTINDLNPHLTYTASSIPEAQREQSVGDPRAIVWNAAGTVGYVSGMGSNNVIAIGPNGARLGRLDVGQGPTGLALRESASRLYVLNHFGNSISEVDTATMTEASRVGFFDPTPPPVRNGRPFLYDTHLTSGLGNASCGSCHVDGKMDGLAWDLGATTGDMKTVNQPCRQALCQPWHPMKGPMVTQTLQGIVGNGAMHWRGDKENVAAFNAAFSNLQGSVQRSEPELQQFTDFVASIVYPPNPNRNIDGTLRTSLPVTGGPGNAQNGLTLFNTAPIFGGALTCVACHTLPAGTDERIDSPPGLPQSLKDVQLRGMEEKVGFNRGQPNSIRGFGYNHDGTADTLANMFAQPPFLFPPGGAGAQQRRDMEAFFLSFSGDTHAGVGRQATVDSNSNATANALINQMITLANANAVGLVVKGVQGGLQRGWYYLGGDVFQSDRAAETILAVDLLNGAAAGGELTYTMVPFGTQRRIGADRDRDGGLDRDELDLGYDPADPNSTPPAPPCPGDANGDGVIDFADIPSILVNWGRTYPTTGPGDSNLDGTVDFADVTATLANFGQPCL